MAATNLRISDDLHAKLRRKAAMAGRSLNAEIVMALAAHVEGANPTSELSAHLAALGLLVKAEEAPERADPYQWDDVKAVSQALHGALWAYMADAAPDTLPALPSRDTAPVWAADASALLAAYSAGTSGAVEWRAAMLGEPGPLVVDVETPATARNAMRLAAKERRRGKNKVEPLVELLLTDVAADHVLITTAESEAAVASEYAHLYGIGIRQPGALGRVAAVKAAVDPHGAAWAYLTLDPIAAAEAAKLGFVVAG